MAMGLGSSERSRRRRRHRPMAEINVTPFVDVMLVLLIVFMVSAPLLTSGVEVNLPDSEARAVDDPDEAPLVLTLRADGEIYLGESVIASADLPTRLGAIAAERNDARVFLRADGANLYAEVARLMGVLQSAGLGEIVLVHGSDGG